MYTAILAIYRWGNLTVSLVLAHGEIHILCTQLRSVDAVQAYICRKRQHSLITLTKPRNNNSTERIMAQGVTDKSHHAKERVLRFSV